MLLRIVCNESGAKLEENSAHMAGKLLINNSYDTLQNQRHRTLHKSCEWRLAE